MEMKSTKMIIYECNEGDDKGKEKVKMTTMAMEIDSSAKESFRHLTFVFHFQQRRGSHKIFFLVLKSRSSLKIHICSTHFPSEWALLSLSLLCFYWYFSYMMSYWLPEWVIDTRQDQIMIGPEGRYCIKYQSIRKFLNVTLKTVSLGVPFDKYDKRPFQWGRLSFFFRKGK